MRGAWRLLREAAEAFIEDDVLTRGAAIAFVIWIAGLVFGHAAARSAIAWQFHSLMGEDSAKLLLSMLDTAARQHAATVSATARLTSSGTISRAAIASATRRRPQTQANRKQTHPTCGTASPHLCGPSKVCELHRSCAIGLCWSWERAWA
jgi:hypothetical protein